jgi:hypothetical protein
LRDVILNAPKAGEGPYDWQSPFLLETGLHALHAP